jgi:sarcosine oxidase subunit alpha
MPTDAKSIFFTLNGQNVQAPAGSSVAAAVLSNGVSCFRRSATGEPRSPLCGMGICFECRLTIDDLPHQKSCQITLTTGMVVQTDE